MTQDITTSARSLFQARDDLARRLRLTEGLIDGLRKSYAADQRVPFVRPEAFRRECGA